MRILIIDSHRNQTTKRREELCDFFQKVKSLRYEAAYDQTSFCDWFEKEYAVKWLEAVALDGSKVVGYLRCFRNPDKKEEWFIGDVHVRDAYRGKNIATKMYAKMIQTVQEFESAEHIITSVHRDNFKSIGLHEKMGFVNTKKPCEFANFFFDEKETMFKLKLYQSFPVQDIKMAQELLLPVWIAYQKSEDSFQNENDAKKAMNKILVKTIANQTFEAIWCGQRLVGFQYIDQDQTVFYCQE